MAAKELGGRGQCIGLGIEIDPAVAIAVGAVEQNVLGQELRLPDLAMHGAALDEAEIVPRSTSFSAA